MENENTKTAEAMPERTAMGESKPDICPFCGTLPGIRESKKSFCQLHGEPMQPMVIACTSPKCWIKPQVAGGDIFNGGRTKARDEVVALWNTRAAMTAPAAPSQTPLEIAVKYYSQLNPASERLARDIQAYGDQRALTSAGVAPRQEALSEVLRQAIPPVWVEDAFHQLGADIMKVVDATDPEASPTGFAANVGMYLMSVATPPARRDALSKALDDIRLIIKAGMKSGHAPSFQNLLNIATEALATTTQETEGV